MKLCSEPGCQQTALYRPVPNLPLVRYKPQDAQTGGFLGQPVEQSTLCFYHLKKSSGLFDHDVDWHREMHKHKGRKK
jgi:hypothetical protein